jgi:hypothetical protein
MDQKILFSETQQVGKNKIWLLILLAPAILLGILAWQLISGEPVGHNPMSNSSLMMLSVIYLAPAIWVLNKVKFRTRIDAEKIAFGWNIPSKDLNEISVTNIKEMRIIRYRFVGYGYRLSKLYGTVYNVRGDLGLQIIGKNGERLLIGTERPDELKEVIKKIKIS